MRIAVFSDSHGRTDCLERAVLASQPDMALFLGDYVRDAYALRRSFPELDLRIVRGNCDLGTKEPDSLQLEAGGVAVYLAHGHVQGVKYGLDSLANTVYFSGCSLGLYGHTHQRFYRKMGNVTLANPGAMEDGNYALLNAENGCFTFEYLSVAPY